MCKAAKQDGNRLDPLDARKLPLADEIRRWPGKKDTHRWCRGKVGVEHQTHWQPAFSWYQYDGKITSWDKVCSLCGRKLGHWNSRWSRNPQPPDFYRSAAGGAR